MDPVVWPFLFVFVAAIGIFILLAITRDPRRERQPEGFLRHTTRPRLTLRELTDAAGALYEDRGYGVLHDEGDERSGELFVEDPSPLTGQRIYLRVFAVGPEGLVTTRDVRQALDRLTGEPVARAVLLTDGHFSLEARTMALGERVELIEGDALFEALRPVFPRTLPFYDRGAARP